MLEGVFLNLTAETKVGAGGAMNVLMNAVLQCVLPLVLEFAGLLPNNPAAAQQANTPENRRATAAAEQEMKQSVEGILATIVQSRSTNTRGYKVVIHNDGRATAEIGPSY